MILLLICVPLVSNSTDDHVSARVYFLISDFPQFHICLFKIFLKLWNSHSITLKKILLLKHDFIDLKEAVFSREKLYIIYVDS